MFKKIKSSKKKSLAMIFLKNQGQIKDTMSFVKKNL